jgi:hypothetical protein
MPELLTIRVWLQPETIRQLDALLAIYNSLPEGEPFTRESFIIGSLPRWIADEWEETKE